MRPAARATEARIRAIIHGRSPQLYEMGSRAFDTTCPDRPPLVTIIASRYVPCAQRSCYGSCSFARGLVQAKLVQHVIQRERLTTPGLLRALIQGRDLGWIERLIRVVHDTAQQVPGDVELIFPQLVNDFCTTARSCDRKPARGEASWVAGPFRPWRLPHLCETCLNCPANAIFEALAVAASGALQAYATHWNDSDEAFALCPSPRPLIPQCPSPYRLFVRDDGAWRITDVERDGPPTEAVAWCDLHELPSYALRSRYEERLRVAARPPFPQLHGVGIGMPLSSAAYVAVERAQLVFSRWIVSDDDVLESYRAFTDDHLRRVLVNTARRRGFAGTSPSALPSPQTIGKPL